VAFRFVFGESLHLLLGFGRGPQSETFSSSFPSSPLIHSLIPQNGAKLHFSPTLWVLQEVDAKQTPGKSKKTTF